MVINRFNNQPLTNCTNALPVRNQCVAPANGTVSNSVQDNLFFSNQSNEFIGSAPQGCNRNFIDILKNAVQNETIGRRRNRGRCSRGCRPRRARQNRKMVRFVMNFLRGGRNSCSSNYCQPRYNYNSFNPYNSYSNNMNYSNNPYQYSYNNMNYYGNNSYYSSNPYQYSYGNNFAFNSGYSTNCNSNIKNMMASLLLKVMTRRMF